MRTILFSLILLIASVNIIEAQDEIQLVRVNFQNPEGYTRQLLLGFVPDNSATDGTDYGYDALNIDDLPNDLNWIIEEQRYIIQGVGEFNTNKYYPLGMFLADSGDVHISLDSLENFDQTIEVYLYDVTLDTYTLLNDVDYSSNLTADIYLNRFYITFSNSVGAAINEDLLSVAETKVEDLKIWHSSLQNELNIKGVSDSNHSLSIVLYSLDGKQIMREKIFNPSLTDLIKLQTSNISAGVYILKIESDVFAHTSKVCLGK